MYIAKTTKQKDCWISFALWYICFLNVLRIIFENMNVSTCTPWRNLGCVLFSGAYCFWKNTVLPITVIFQSETEQKTGYTSLVSNQRFCPLSRLLHPRVVMLGARVKHDFLVADSWVNYQRSIYRINSNDDQGSARVGSTPCLTTWTHLHRRKSPWIFCWSNSSVSTSFSSLIA